MRDKERVRQTEKEQISKKYIDKEIVSDEQRVSEEKKVGEF